MPLEFSVWPKGSIEKYRQLALEIAHRDSQLGAQQVAALKQLARDTDLAQLGDAEVDHFIDVVLELPDLQDFTRVVRPYRFGRRRFTDPVELASHMTTNWDAVATVFTSAQECATLRAWIRDEADDRLIEVNLLTPVADGDQSQIDARIIEFTAHYLGADGVKLRGASVNPGDLAQGYLVAGEHWHEDPVLSALTPPVLAALAETRLDEGAGADNQSIEYCALANMARHADEVDRWIERATSLILEEANPEVEGAAIENFRAGISIRSQRARALARAALLSSAAAEGIRSKFIRLYGDPSKGWKPRDPEWRKIASASLAVAVHDLPTLYGQALEAERQALSQALEAELQRIADHDKDRDGPNVTADDISGREPRRSADATQTARVDEYGQFRRLVSDSVGRILECGAPTRTWSDDNGFSVNGWLIDRNSYDRSIGWSPDNDWSDDFGHTEQILGDNGNLYEYRFWLYGDRRTAEEKAHTLRELTAADLVDKYGPSFNSWSDQIKRMVIILTAR